MMCYLSELGANLAGRDKDHGEVEEEGSTSVVSTINSVKSPYPLVEAYTADKATRELQENIEHLKQENFRWENVFQL